MGFGLRGAIVAAMVLLPFAVRAATLEVRAKLLKATPAPTLRQIAPYPRALCTYLYEVEKVVAGEYDEERILVVKWAVWDRKKLDGLPSEAGEQEHLKLDLWIDHREFARERIVDAIREVDRVIYYDVESQPEKGDALPAPKNGVIRGTLDGWLFLEEDVTHLKSGRFWEQDWKEVSRAGVDPLPAMLDYQRRLAELDVRLLVVPVPPKAEIYRELLKQDEAAAHSEYLKVLKAAGLAVLDLAPLVEANKAHGTYCEQDSHWSSRGCALAAEAIRKRLAFPKADLRAGVAKVGGERRIRGDLARMLDDPGFPAERMEIVGLRFTEKGRSLGLAHPDSPIVLLGDSHVTVFSAGDEDLHGAGAGLPDNLFLELGFPVDVIASNGDGVHQARINLYQQRSINPQYLDYWKTKKWVIWCFAAREFTQAERWSTKVPVVKGR